MNMGHSSSSRWNRLILLSLLSVDLLNEASCFINGPASKLFKASPNTRIIQQPSPFAPTSPSNIDINWRTRSNSVALRASPLLSPQATNDLLVYFIQTLISVGVPTVATIVVIGFAAASFGRANKNKDGRSSFMEEKNLAQELYSDLYGSTNDKQSSMPFPFPRSGGKPALPRNSGIPTEQYIKITHLNSRLDSYEYSLSAAIKSKASAATTLRSKNFDRAVDKVFLGKELTDRQKFDLELVEKEFLEEGGELLAELEEIQRANVDKSLERWLGKLEREDEEMGYEEEDKSIVDVEIVNATSNVTKSAKKSSPNLLQKMMNAEQRQLNKQLEEANKIYSKLTTLELDFMKDIMTILGAERAAMAKALWLGNVVDGASVGGSLLRGLKARPLSTLLSSASERKRNLFVTNFPGDVSASQVNELREEVTAILRAASAGDEVLVVLQSGGGTVTGYGLAAAQLKRFKANGLKLTICVEQVAASGGYMMTCVADKVVASPFAVLGSIGVISDIPNVYDRLKREGIEFQTITAGKYKRTITPTKKPTPEDIQKSKEDIEDILTLFKSFVKENRPILDIDKVATGETWFGQDALDRNLCDEIRTKDDVLLEYVDTGFEVYDVAYEPPLEQRNPLLAFSANADTDSRRSGGIMSWLVRSLVNEVKKELGADQGIYGKARSSDKVMMKDDADTADRIRFEA